MKRLFRVVAVLPMTAALLSLIPGSAAHAGDQSFHEIATREITAYMKNGTPGVEVIYVGAVAGENYIQLGTAGWAGSHEKITPGTVFEIGSVTKVFTATLADLALAQSGGLTLNSPVGPTLAKYPNSEPSQTFGQITFAQLASHTSGLPSGGVSGHPSDELFNDEAPSQQIVDFWHTYAAKKKRAPGTCYDYSNIGFVTLGFAASQILAPGPQSQYTSLLASRVTNPLQMYCTSALVSHYPVGPCTLAKGSFLIGGGKTRHVTTNASDLKSDGADMGLWLFAQLGLPTKNPTPPPAALNAAIEATHVITAQKPACKSGAQTTVALGWNMVYLDPGTPANGYLYTKNGATSLGGMSDALAFSLDHKVGIVVLTNAVSHAGAEGDEAPADDAPDTPKAPKNPQALANDLLRKWIAMGGG